MSKILNNLPNTRPWIASVDDERSHGHSIIVTLTNGYCFADDPGCGVKGFDTVAEARDGTRITDVTSTAVGDMPIPCSCGSAAVGPSWVPRARGYAVRCQDKGCQAYAQASTAQQATERWNQTASKI